MFARQHCASCYHKCSKHIALVTSDDQQCRALMDAGVTYAQSFKLRPGIALSAEQVARLTSDIVWLQQESVTLPDGSQTLALVPHVYLAPQAGDLAPSGGLMSGASLNITSKDGVTNAGTMLGRTVVQINADTIHNIGGKLRGNAVALNAAKDINNTGGTITAQDQLLLQAGRDINNTSTVATASTGDSRNGVTNTTLDRVAGLYVTGNNGVLLASAGRDINLVASVIKNSGADSDRGGQTTLVAQNDINLGTLQTRQVNNQESDAGNYRRATTTAEVGSTIAGTGNVTLTAGNDLNARAAQVSAGKTLDVAAGNNIILQAGQATTNVDQMASASGKDLFFSSSIQTRYQEQSATAQVSSFSGQSTQLVANNNLVSIGAKLQASGADTGTGTLHVEGKNNTLLYEVQDVKQVSTTTHTTTGLGVMFDPLNIAPPLEDKTVTDARATSTAIGTKLISNQKVVIGVGNKTELRGTEVEAPQIAFVKTDPTKAGELVLAGSTNTTQVSHTEKTETAGVYQEMKGHGSTTQTLNQTQLKGNVSFDSALKITVQIPKDVQATPGGQALQSQLQALSKSPLASTPQGLAYLEQLKANPNVKWDQIALANEKWSYEQAGLTPAGTALLSIAVAAYAPGLSTGITSAVGGGSIAAGLNAGFIALQSQAAVALVNNGGDIGKTLSQLGSEQSIKNLLTTMVTAGALNALGNSTLFNGQSGTAAAGSNGISTAQTAATFGDKLLKNITNNLAGSAIDAAINGKPFDEKTLTNALTSALVTAGMAQGANAIGDAKYDGDINGFTQKVAHAVLGCAGGAATAGNMSGCGAGAVGAVVGEMAAEYYMDSHKDNGKTFAENKANALAFAKVMSATAGVIAGGGGDNAAAVNIANTTGANAAENNFLTHAQAKSMKDDMAACKATRCSAEEERVIRDRYIGLSHDNISAVQAMIVAGDAAGVKKLEEQAASSREVSGIFGIRQDEEIFTNRQNNINIHGAVKGKDSLFGSDLQQAQEVARFRKDNCAGISAGACNQLVTQALDDRMKRVGILMAAGAVAPAAVNGIRVLRASGKPTTGSSSASTTKDSPTSSRGKPDEMLPDASLANVYANQNGGKPLGKPLGSYDMTSGGGPLPSNLAGTFSGGRYMEIVTTEPVVLYRAGTKDVPLGQFFSTEQPTGVIQTRVDQAVLPVWPGGGKSPLDSVFKVTVPPGTKLYYGEIGAQNGFYVGGTPQIVVQAPWKIPSVKSELIGPLK